MTTELLRCYDEGAAAAADVASATTTTEATTETTVAPGASQTTTEATTEADWRLGLTEDLRGHASLAKIANLDGLAKSFISAQKFMGKDPASLIEWPVEVTPEFRKDLLTRLGAPAEAKGFQFKISEGVDAKRFGTDTPLATGFAETAAKAGLLPDQAQSVFQWATDLMAGAVQEKQTASDSKADEEIMALKAELGPSYQQDVQAANFAMHRLGLEELKDEIADAGLGTKPAFIKALAQVGKLLAETPAPDQPGQATFDSFGKTASSGEERSKAAALQQSMIDEKNPATKKAIAKKIQEHLARANQPAG